MNELGRQSFGLKITVLPWATFLVSNGDHNVAYNFMRFVANDVSADKLPEQVAHDNNTI